MGVLDCNSFDDDGDGVEFSGEFVIDGDVIRVRARGSASCGYGECGNPYYETD
jgi:hypothetical protein